MKLFSRRTEAGLLLLAAIILLLAIVALEISQGKEISSEVFYLVGGFFLTFLVAHLVVCWTAPEADQIMLPIAALLNGLGLVMIYRLDLGSGLTLAKSQIMWTALGVILFCPVSYTHLRAHETS